MLPNSLAPGDFPYASRRMPVLAPHGVVATSGMNPQTSLDAPRWRWLRGREVLMEPAAGSELIEGLIARGHEVSIADTETQFNGNGGRGQIIRRLPNGGYMAGSEPRSDGAAVGY